MKSVLSLITILGTIALLSGCDSMGVSARIQEKPTVYAALSPEQKRMINDGEIEVGFTADMVYLSLGKASKTEIKDTPDGPITVLTFNKYYPSQGTARMVESNAGGMSYGPRTGRPVAGVSVPTGTVGQVLQSLEPGDLPVHSLIVSIYKNRVYEIALSR